MAKKAAPGRVAFTEIGVTGLNYQSGYVNEEFLPQLSGLRFIRAMKEMSENDAVVGGMLFAIEMMVRGVEWSVEPGGESAEDKAAAEFLETIPDDMDHSWQAMMSEWSGTVPVYGFGPFEFTLKRRVEGLSHYADNLIGVRSIDVRHPDTLDKWVFDDNGRAVALVQRAAPDWRPRTIPMGKLLLFRVRRRKNSPEGRSLLRNAWTAYNRKKRIEDVEGIGIERDLAGFPVAWVPPNLMSSTASAADQALFTLFKQTITRMKRDELEGAVWPLAYDGDGNKLYDLTLLTTAGQRQFDTSKIIERYDRRITMSILADVIMIGHEKVGSFALSETKSNLFVAGIDSMLDDAEDVLNRDLVPTLLAINGFQLEKLPKFKHGAVQNIDLIKLGDFVAKLAGAGAGIFPSTDGELERTLLRSADLPSEGMRDPEELLSLRQMAAEAFQDDEDDEETDRSKPPKPGEDPDEELEE